jgi:hypothetical protein
MALTRLLHRPGQGPGAAHRDALEQDLLARYRELHPRSLEERDMTTTMTWRAAVLGGLVLALAGASQAPADVKAEIGKRIELTGEAPLPPEQLRALVKALEAGGRRFEVRVQVRREGEKQVRTTIELFGATVGLADVEATVHQAVPALAGRPIQVSAVERAVPGNLGDVAGRWAGREKQLAPDELKQAIEAELREREPGARVDVQVEDREGKREVKVEVRKEAEAPAPK